MIRQSADSLTLDFRIVATRPGGPEVMAVQPIAAASPEPHAVRLRHRAVGVNFVDTYHRSGLYPNAMPVGLGGEAAGVVEAVGEAVNDFAVGDRVAYGTGGQGAYATVRVLPAEHLVHLPPAISDETAAAAMLKGMTAAYLVGPCGRVAAGQWVLVHAAAGGVGTILVQWLRGIGAKVIAHVGSAGKVARVAALGADHVLSCAMEMLPGEVARITDAKGAWVVFDGVGASSWQASLRSVATRGLLVSYGNASGPVPAFRPLDLAEAGSVYVTRPKLRDYARTRAERQALADALFTMITSGTVKIEIGQRFALECAADAHRTLEARQTIGSTILVPKFE